jgi:hypothetical protein
MKPIRKRALVFTAAFLFTCLAGAMSATAASDWPQWRGPLRNSSGAKIIMLKPSPEKRIQLAKANARALWVPSPAIVDGKLLLRGRKGISCYSLAASPARSKN